MNSLKSLPFDLVLGLTEREYEVFLLLGEGMTVSEIRYTVSGRPGIKTIESHIANIRMKLNLDHYPLRAYATRYLVHKEQTGIERTKVDKQKTLSYTFNQLVA